MSEWKRLKSGRAIAYAPLVITLGRTHMEPTYRIQFAGWCGIVGAALWVVAVVIEHAFNLQPPNSGTLFYANQAMSCVAEVGWVIAIIGLMWAHAAGDGWFGTIALDLFAFG